MSDQATARARSSLIEKVASAFRARGPQGQIRPAPAWHDLDSAGRLEAHQAALIDRQIEAALHPDGLSTTALAVLARIQG